MGGKIFEGTRSLSYHECQPTLAYAAKQFLNRLTTEWYVLGSLADPKMQPYNCFSKGNVGDIDIAIKWNVGFCLEDHAKARNQLAIAVAELVGDKNVKKHGQFVHVRVPIAGDVESFVQIDLVPTRFPRDMSWLMRGTRRSLLLSFLAKNASYIVAADRKYKITVAPLTGLKIIYDNKTVIRSSLNPSLILFNLNVSANANQCLTFSSLAWHAMKNSSARSALKNQFSTYIKNFSNKSWYKSTLDEIESIFKFYQLKNLHIYCNDASKEIKKEAKGISTTANFC